MTLYRDNAASVQPTLVIGGNILIARLPPSAQDRRLPGGDRQFVPPGQLVFAVTHNRRDGLAIPPASPPSRLSRSPNKAHYALEARSKPRGTAAQPCFCDASLRFLVGGDEIEPGHVLRSHSKEAILPLLVCYSDRLRSHPTDSDM